MSARRLRGVSEHLSRFFDLFGRRPSGDSERVLHHEQARRREAEAIAEVAKSLTQGLDLGTVARRIADHSRDVLGVLASVVYRVDRDSGDLVAVAIAGDMGATFGVGGRLPRGTGLAGLAATERRVMSTPDVVADPRLGDVAAASPNRAVLAVPLIVKDEVVGVLSAGDRPGRRFSRDELRLAEALADHAAIALDNARLYADAEQRRREAEDLARVAAELTERVDLADVAQRVVDAVGPLFRARAAGLRLVQPDGTLLGVAFAGLMKEWFPPGHVAPAGSMISGRAIAEGRPVRTANVFSDQAVSVPDDVRAGMTAAGDGAVLAVPLRVKGAIIGALSIADRPGRVFTQTETELLQAFADQAAVAIERARLHEQTELRRREAEIAAERARLLAEASRVLASSLDLDATLTSLTRVIVPALADWCAVHLVQAQGAIRRVATAAADPTKADLAERIQRTVRARALATAEGVVAQAIRSGAPLLVSEVTDAWLESTIEDAPYLELVRELDPRSLMMVPLVARGRAIGTITFVRTHPDAGYTDQDLRYVEDLAARAGLAIDNTRLFQQRERARVDAERANRSKDEFLAVLSHELRTPLTSMLGWVRILRSGPLASERVETALEVIERNAHAQAQLINDLLDVSRIIAGKLQLDRYAVDLVPLTLQAIDSLAREAEAKGVSIVRALGPSATYVLGDPTRLHQVLTNLLSNAIKFTGAAGVVTVRLETVDSVARVAITDTGVGIPSELLPHVFDRFRQADSTITRTYGGLGLGLAIVRHLVELHGGTVRAESDGAGKGATFIIELPVVTDPQPPRSARRPGRGRTRRLDGVRVLLAEDDADTRDLVRFMLEENGAIVRAVGTVGDALDQLTEVRPDVVVTDLAMPGSDGYDLLRAIRALGSDGARLPIVALTAYAGAHDRARALAAGFTAHLAKPIEPTALAEAITEIVGRAPADR